MAIAQLGIVEEISGSIGNCIIYKRFKKTIIRSKAFNPKNPKTPGQQKQRLKFVLVQRLDSILKRFIRTGFPEQAHLISQYNSFMKANLKTAVKGEYPDMEIDYSKLVVAQGSLMGFEEPTINADQKHTVTIEWQHHSKTNNNRSNDIAMALLINPEQTSIVMDVTSACRADKKLEIEVPYYWEGDQVYVYLTFREANGIKIANSKFLGTVTIAGKDVTKPSDDHYLHTHQKADLEEIQYLNLVVEEIQEACKAREASKNNETCKTRKICTENKDKNCWYASSNSGGKKNSTEVCTSYKINKTSEDKDKKSETNVIYEEREVFKQETEYIVELKEQITCKTHDKINEKQSMPNNKNSQHAMKRKRLQIHSSKRRKTVLLHKIKNGKNSIFNIKTNRISERQKNLSLVCQENGVAIKNFMANTG